MSQFSRLTELLAEPCQTCFGERRKAARFWCAAEASNIESTNPKWADLGSGRSRMVARLALVAQVIGWFSVAVGVVVLAVGWWLGHPSVASLIPGRSP